MMIHGLGFLSLSASLVLPWALTALVQGERITESLVKDVRQSSTLQQMPLPSRKLISRVTTATTYYVSGTGNDRNSGLTTSSAFRTIQRAADLTDPGDTVLIMNGVYRNPPNAGSVVNIQRSGNAKAWIKYKAYPGHFPKIEHDTWNGIKLSNGASYIEINGLEIIGDNANITLGYALSQKWNKSNRRTNGSGITVDGVDGHLSHINILNNIVHDCGGGGIGTREADYVRVDNNTVYKNAWYSVFGPSGISISKSWNSDSNRGYKMFVTNNRVYKNRMYIPWLDSGTISDGNGIIVDVSKLARNGAYRGRTLIANNISYKNGGSGIHAHSSEHVDIVNNTAYENAQSSGLRKKGQIYAGYSSDVKIFNNIIYAPPGQNANSNMKNINVTYDYNLYNKGVVIAAMGPHDIIADPQLMNPSIGDFRIKRTSPAINSGYNWKELKTDYAGKPRRAGSRSDIGAYEEQ